MSATVGAEPKTHCRLRLIQSACDEGCRVSNLEHALSLIQSSAGRAHLVAFPEGCVTGRLAPPSEEDVERLADRALLAFRDAARRAEVAVVVNLPEWDAGKLFSAAYLISEQGHVIAWHRKVFLAPFEAGLVSSGSRFVACRWRGLQIGLLLGGEIEHPAPMAALAAQGAELVVVCGAYTRSGRDTRRELVASMAARYGMSVALVNRTGEGDGEFYCGDSAVFDAEGDLRAQDGFQESVLDTMLEVKQREWA
jgi:(R)-amidase